MCQRGQANDDIQSLWRSALNPKVSCGPKYSGTLIVLFRIRRANVCIARVEYVVWCTHRFMKVSGPPSGQGIGHPAWQSIAKHVFTKIFSALDTKNMRKRRRADDIVMERGWSMVKRFAIVAAVTRCNICKCVQCIMHALDVSARVHHYASTYVEEKTCCTVIHLLVGEVSQSANRQSAPLLPGNHWQIRCNLAHLTKTSPLID